MKSTVELFTSKRKLERTLKGGENNSVCITVQLGRVDSADKFETIDNHFIEKAEERNCSAVLKRNYRTSARKGVEYVGYQILEQGWQNSVSA